MGRGVSERVVVGADSFPRLPHSRKHTCRCRLMGCDMDNSLHRSHQYTRFQHWRVPDTHTDTDRHKCHAHTHAHLTTQRCVSSQARFPQMERHIHTHLNTNTHKLHCERRTGQQYTATETKHKCAHTRHSSVNMIKVRNKTKDCSGQV